MFTTCFLRSLPEMLSHKSVQDTDSFFSHAVDQNYKIAPWNAYILIIFCPGLLSNKTELSHFLILQLFKLKWRMREADSLERLLRCKTYLEPYIWLAFIMVCLSDISWSWLPRGKEFERNGRVKCRGEMMWWGMDSNSVLVFLHIGTASVWWWWCAPTQNH